VTQSPSPNDRVLLSVTVEEAERLLSWIPSRECPRCNGTRQMERLGAFERCTQCQGVGRIPWRTD